MTGVLTEPATGPAAVAAELRAALARRSRGTAGPAADERGGPTVVPLGTADALDPARDPFAADRARATVHVTPQAILVGPWGTNDDGEAAPGCGHCLAMRWQRLRPKYEREALEFGAPPHADGAWPVLTAYLVDAVRLAHQGTVEAGAVGGGPRVTRVDLRTLETRTFPLLADPLCPSCARHGTRDDSPRDLALTSRTKPSPAAYRLRRPESYGLDADALANPVCGVLGTGTAMNVMSPTTAPVSGRVMMRGHAGLTDLTWSGQANSYGESRNLAFLEGLERYAGTRRRHREDVLVEAYDAVADRALDPRDVGMYGPRTYEHDPMLTPFDPARPIPWVWGYSLRDERPLLVPSRLAYYSSGAEGDNFVFECSNGCASGGSLEEAVLFGMLELIERDAFLLGWYGGAELPGIDISDTEDTELRTMVDRADLHGYDLRVFDNRIDLRVPVATAVAVRRDGGDGALSFAAGASMDPATAVRAAVSETLTYIPELPLRVSTRREETVAMTRDYHKVLQLRDHAALFALPEMAEHAQCYLRPMTARPEEEVYRSWREEGPRSTELLDDVRYCRDELVRAGYDVIVVDQTSPEQEALGLRTVCVIVPGLLPIDFGWARQRALHMPRTRTAFRRAGWRADDLTEAELHKVPHPFP